MISFSVDEVNDVLVHQSRWQQRILLLYGNDMCLMNTTYKTTWYELPLFVLCVSINVGYVNVASFLLADEKCESTQAGLRKISQWNPDWHPKHFFVRLP